MDSEVNAALDILTEFCTQKDKENATPFHTFFKGSPTATEVKLLKDALQKWVKQQQFETRIFRIFRNTMKYGDCFFVRDPETKKWMYVDAAKVSKIIVNESEGKIPEQYVIRDINFNFKEMVAVTPHGTTNTAPSGTSSYTSGGSMGRGMVGNASQPPGTRFSNQMNEVTIDAKNDSIVSKGIIPFDKEIAMESWLDNDLYDRQATIGTNPNLQNQYYNYRLRDIFVLEDGSIVGSMEQYYVYRRANYDNRTGMSSNVTYYYYDDIIAFKIGKAGTFDWQKRIPK
jgi:hypothetical protein